MNEEIKKILPGLCMGFTRSLISHPFEIMKLKSQLLTRKEDFFHHLFRGLHYSIISNSLERGIQFYYFEKFKRNYGLLCSSVFSSLISTSITFPYNIILLRQLVKTPLQNHFFYRCSLLEYSRNLLGSTIFLYSYDRQKSNHYSISFSAVSSSFCVWLFTYPIDNIKNQLFIGNQIQYNIRFLYKGIQYPLIRSIPSSIVGLNIYERVNKYINN